MGGSVEKPSPIWHILLTPIALVRPGLYVISHFTAGEPLEKSRLIARLAGSVILLAIIWLVYWARCAARDPSMSMRFPLLVLKLFLMVIVTAMLMFQVPELRYDLGAKTPIHIESPNDLSAEYLAGSTFAAVHGKADLARAASFSRYGVRYTYFLLDGYGTALVVRTIEGVDEDWEAIDLHVGRLKPYGRMAFRRSVRAGFREHFDIGIPEDALFLGRDDVPELNGWSMGATIFAGTMWCVLAFLFFVFPCMRRRWGKGCSQTAVDGGAL